MYEVRCLDFDGNTINNLFQWDVDQYIILNVDNRDAEYLSIAPEVHFANAQSKDALVVRSVKRIVVDALPTTSAKADKEVIYIFNNNAYIWNGTKCVRVSKMTLDMKNTVVSKIPNILLQDAVPLQVYVYLTDNAISSSQKTILTTQIPIRKRKMPSDHSYVENITRVTAERIKNEIAKETERSRQQAITDITNEKNNSINAVLTAKQGFVSAGDKIVNDANAIKTNIQNIYNNTVTTSKQTQTKIETDINNMIKNGLELRVTDDGAGNVTMNVGFIQSPIV